MLRTLAMTIIERAPGEADGVKQRFAGEGIEIGFHIVEQISCVVYNIPLSFPMWLTDREV